MQFFENLFRSLETEMSARFNAIDARYDGMDARLDQMNARLERVGGLLNSGGRAMTRLVDWSEKTDDSMANILRRCRALEDRISKWEKDHGNA